MSYRSTYRLILAFSLFLMAGTLNAAKITVHNIAGFDADYFSIQDAITNANPGDTIYVHGSPLDYGSAVLNKPLTIFGAGFFLADNDFTLEKKFSSRITTLDFFSGSQGSYVYGLSIERDVDISVNNIQLLRCRIVSGELVLVDIRPNVQNVTIGQCLIHLTSNTTSNTYRCIALAGNNAAIQIVNNIIIRGNGDNGAYDYAIYSPADCAPRISQNVVVGNWETYNGYINNNIHASGDFQGEYNSLFYNLSSSTWFGTNQGNQANVNMNTVFAKASSGATYEKDAYWELLAGSPAIGAGQGGRDCGVYAGNWSWKKSGLSPIPAIFEADVPSTGSATTGMDIILDIKSHR